MTTLGGVLALVLLTVGLTAVVLLPPSVIVCRCSITIADNNILMNDHDVHAMLSKVTCTDDAGDTPVAHDVTSY